MDAKQIWQGVYDKEFHWKSSKRFGKAKCFFGSHKMMPLDEMADLIQCERCGRKERFYRGSGYYEIQGEEG